MTFMPFNPLLCDELDLAWYDGFNLPQFRTVEVKDIRILETKSILFKNSLGQIINMARAVGTDKGNVRGLINSFTTQGWDVSKLPPIVEESDLSLYDGFSRQEALLQMDQKYGFYLVVRKKSRFSKEAVIDEIGLGANNHSQHKKATMDDFKKRLAAFIARSKKEVTMDDARAWFDGINHSFDEEKINNAIYDTFQKIAAADTMESFGKPDAEKKAAVLMNKKNSDGIIAIGKKGVKRGSYLKRCVTDALFYYADTGKVPEFVSFLKDVPAEHAETRRKELEQELKSVNEALVGLFYRYKQDPDFQFINFKGHLPQVLGKESEMINY